MRAHVKQMALSVSLHDALASSSSAHAALEHVALAFAYSTAPYGMLEYTCYFFLGQKQLISTATLCILLLQCKTVCADLYLSVYAVF